MEFFRNLQSLSVSCFLADLSSPCVFSGFAALSACWSNFHNPMTIRSSSFHTASGKSRHIWPRQSLHSSTLRWWTFHSPFLYLTVQFWNNACSVSSRPLSSSRPNSGPLAKVRLILSKELKEVDSMLYCWRLMKSQIAAILLRMVLFRDPASSSVRGLPQLESFFKVLVRLSRVSNLLQSSSSVFYGTCQISRFNERDRDFEWRGSRNWTYWYHDCLWGVWFVALKSIFLLDGGYLDSIEARLPKRLKEAFLYYLWRPSLLSWLAWAWIRYDTHHGRPPKSHYHDAQGSKSFLM